MLRRHGRLHAAKRRHGRGDPCGRPHTGICQEDMCCGDSRLVSPQATLFSEKFSCRNHHILLSSRYFYDRLFQRQVVSRQVVFFNKHGRLRRRRASKARNTCPPSPSHTCSPPSGTPDMRHLSAGYARPKGLAHPRLSMVGPLRGPAFSDFTFHLSPFT